MQVYLSELVVLFKALNFERNTTGNCGVVVYGKVKRLL
ncbi:hypothetical protein HPSD74_1146 [Glaesserella parasuis D74]|nr:hypothetical protein HPSD74_1146 [Glaesserella parasuis D74]